ncbi:MAG: hypothetical protein H6R40_1663 [Gemmatimonadetes bacterium]|nr:hypothetical protein [Gemmatimonadota bacterium]
MAGPPMEVVVPMKPDSAPAAIRVRGAGRRRSPVADRATPRRIRPPNSTSSHSWDSTVSTARAATVPTTRPPMDQVRSSPWTEAQSRRVIISVRSPEAQSIGPGTSAGLTSSSRGALNRASPNPMVPWSRAPIAMMTVAAPN